MRSHLLRINTAHLKYRIEKNYLLETDIANKGFILCLIMASVTLQLDMSKMTIENIVYDQLFKDNLYITDLRTILTRIGITEPEVFFGHLEYVQDFLASKFDPRLKNFFSVAYDSGYHLNIHLKQTR